MNKKIAMIIAWHDFRDVEYFIPKQIFEAADIQVTTVSTDLGTAVGIDGGDTEVDVLINELDAADYGVDLENGIVSSWDWPGGSKKFDSFKIDYKSGLGVDVDAVPEEVKTAVKQIVTHWYQFRQPFAAETIKQVPDMAQAIMRKYSAPRI